MAGRQTKGGAARAAVLSPARRSEIAQEAARTRWAKPGAKDTLRSAGFAATPDPQRVALVHEYLGYAAAYLARVAGNHDPAATAGKLENVTEQIAWALRHARILARDARRRAERLRDAQKVEARRG